MAAIRASYSGVGISTTSRYCRRGRHLSRARNLVSSAPCVGTSEGSAGAASGAESLNSSSSIAISSGLLSTTAAAPGPSCENVASNFTCRWAENHLLGRNVFMSWVIGGEPSSPFAMSSLKNGFLVRSDWRSPWCSMP